MSKRLRLILLAIMVASQFVVVAAARADDGTHVVQKGETLFRISLKYGVSVEALRQANGLSGNLIYAGQTLVIPGTGTGAGAPSTVNNPPASNSDSNSSSSLLTNGLYVVQRGDTLFKISVKWGTTVSALQALNNITGTRIYAGQSLKIPGFSDTSTAPSQPATTDPAPTPEPTAPPAPPAPAGGGKRFLVDLSEQMLYAYEGDTLVRSTLISSGLWPNTTVTGTFYIYLKYTSQRMRGPGYDLPGVPYVMYFYQGYALHGTYWHNNFGNPMSHGCVNMPTSEAEWAFNWAPIGTPVTVQW